MDSTTAVARSAPSITSCQFVVRNEDALFASTQFIIAGIEAGQQVFAMAEPARLKNFAGRLTGKGFRPDALLRNRRLVFLTAPNCMSTMFTSDELLRGGPFLRNGSPLRWLSDWSWTCDTSLELRPILKFQRSIHDFVHSVAGLSLCTVHGECLERSSLLALMADHRRTAKPATAREMRSQ
jgi:DcmR-like sensory protein